MTPGDILPFDAKLDLKIQTQGGFSSTLSFQDRQRLRRIVKQVHLANYPQSMINDYEADKVIDVLAPETMAYLIERKWADIK